MQYEIWGGQMPAVTMQLNAGESVYTQSGGLSWMSDGISMETNICLLYTSDAADE